MDAIVELTLAVIMTRTITHVLPDCPLGDAARLMASKCISSLLVMNAEKQAIGILTERDLLRLLNNHTPIETPVANVMSTPVLVLPESTDMETGYRIAMEHHVRHLVLKDEQENIVGIVSETDFLHQMNVETLRKINDIGAVMEHQFPVLSPRDSLSQATRWMMREQMSYIVIAENNIPIGILTERDMANILVEYADANADMLPLSTFAHSPIFGVPLSVSIHEAAHFMQNRHVRHVAILQDNGEIIGMVTLHSLIVRITELLAQEKITQQAAQLKHGKQLAEDRFRQLFDNMQIGFVLHEVVTDETEKPVDYIFLAANSAYGRATGFDVEAIIGKSVTEIYPDIVNDKFDWIAFFGAVGLHGGMQRVQSYAEGLDRWYDTIVYQTRYKEFAVLVEDITVRKKDELALQESGEVFRAMFNQAAVGIARVLPDGQWLEMNQKLCDIIGYTRDELLAHRFQDITHPEDLAFNIQSARQILAGEVESCQIEKRYIHKNKTVIWANLTISLVRHSDGEPKYFITVIQDITKRKQDEAQLYKLSQAVEQSFNHIVITDLNARIEYVNAAFTKNTGYEAHEVIGKNPRLLQSGKTLPSTYQEMWTLLKNGESWQGELLNRHKDGREYSEWERITPIRQPDGQISHYLAIKENITERKRADALILKLAHFDILTGLPNHAQLNQRLKAALNHAERYNTGLSVMFLDLDHFKNINDTLGHRVGDELLVEVSRRMRTTLREEDLISRLGGDNFIVLLPGTQASGAVNIAQRLLDEISHPVYIEGHELNLTASIGIAVYPEDGLDIESLAKNADAAMYRTKQEGRNSYRFFTREMGVNAARNLRVINALRHALLRDELYLCYQPQLRLSDGAIVGAEALVRWHHPELGDISPSEFIPLAEENGLILGVGEWVLRQAVRQAKSWQEQGFAPLVVAVNLSAVQFCHADLTDLVVSILAEEGLAADYLELELTEGVAMHDPQHAITVMSALHDSGIHFAIDDFGTGYSSLSYLKKFKIYKLKIDQSFVRDISTDPDDKAIVSAVIQMAKGLGLKTIAEGVETSSQLAFLHEQGCDEVQGFYYSKPLAPEEFKAFMIAHKLQ